MDALKEDLDLSFFSCVRHELMGKDIMVMESFAEHLSSFFLPSYYNELGKHPLICHASLHDLFPLVSSTFDCVEMLQAENMHHF